MEIIIWVIIISVIWYAVRLKGRSNLEIEVGGNIIDRIVKCLQQLLSTNFTKLKKIAQRTISKSYLTGCSWLLVNNAKEDENVIYSFRNNNELLVTKNGIVERFNFELFVDNNSILITKNEVTEHYDIVNIQDDFLFINKLSSNNIMAFANQTKFKDYLKSEIKKQAKIYYKFEEDSNSISKITLETKFYYIDHSKVYGPITAKKLILLVESNQLNKNSFVRQVSEKEFEKRAFEIQELFN